MFNRRRSKETVIGNENAKTECLLKYQRNALMRWKIYFVCSFVVMSHTLILPEKSRKDGNYFFIFFLLFLFLHQIIRTENPHKHLHEMCLIYFASCSHVAIYVHICSNASPCDWFYTAITCSRGGCGGEMMLVRLCLNICILPGTTTISRSCCD